MKRPTWATVVGIIGIIISILRILGAGQTIIMPQMMEFQKEMMANIQKADMSGPKEREAREKAMKMMNRMFEVPEGFRAWCIAIGLLGLVVSGVYLLASIWLLLTKKAAIGLFYWAAGSRIGLAILTGVIALSNISFMAIVMMIGSAFGMIIDIVLLIVVATGKKEAFYVSGQRA